MTLVVRERTVRAGAVTLVDRFSLSLQPGRVHAVVGESGSGKTLSALSVMNLLPDGLSCDGSVELDGAPLRGREGLAMVLQEPLGALDPVLSIGAQLRETLEVHRNSTSPEALLAEVGIPEPASRLTMFPHQLSGGQRQRVAIACALAASPRVLIADEPTTALDASLKRVILALLRDLAARRQLHVWLITHDLRSVEQACDDLTVMYAGRVVESGATREVLAAPRHPYTAALWATSPAATAPGAPLPTLQGRIPAPAESVSGCRFHPRCPKRLERCSRDVPAFARGVACHLDSPEPRP